MRKIATLLVAAVFSVLVISGGAIMAADQEVPDEITIEHKYSSDKKGPVPFHHKQHTEYEGVECADCHHVYEGGKNVWKEGDHVDKCVKCHDLEETKGDIVKLQLALHKNCKDCHKEMAKDTAPWKKCNDCHKK